MSEASVFRFASVVFWVMLSGSRSTLPHLPVAGSTRFGTFPAAIRSPSGFPEIDSPLMNRAAVNAEATVVSSLTVTVFGNVGSQQRHQRHGLVGAFVRRGLRRAAFGDEIKHAVFRRVFGLQFERAIAVGLALGQLRGSALACRVKGHRRSGDGTAGALDVASEVRGHRRNVRERESK